MDKTKAVILARVSSKSQEDEGYSLDSQLKLLESYCNKNGLNVVRVFKITETASKEQSRKIFHEMLSFISYNKIYHLAVEKTDRFTRNFRDAVAIDEWLDKDEERRLHAVKENLLLHKNAKSDVKFMWNIHISVAKKYTDNLREEAMKGWAEKLAQGWLPSSPPPGYITITQNGKKIHVPDPEMAPLMQQAFHKFLEPGSSILTTAQFMESMGMRTTKGHPYNKSYVHELLMNPFYIGINRFNGKDYPGAQEPIISQELFEAVQDKLHGKRPKSLKRHNPTLKGLITCEHCGTAVTWQLQKGRYYGICRQGSDACKHAKMLREDLVEDLLLAEFKRLVCPAPEIIEWLIETIRSDHESEITNQEQMARAINAQIARIERMEEVLYDDKLSGEITKERYEVKHEQLVNEKTELHKRLAGLNQSLSQLTEYRLAILELSQQAAQIFPEKSPEQKRFILSKLFAKLTIKDNLLSVTYTKFTKVIADKVAETYKIMEVIK